ncbi:SRPBCC family protein [Natronorubrum daqingense]|uniref:Uncharacterized membrane protein n=1 Tax=Natronorubrum daqingense TaxID=588898 RepID=A0A1N7C592_9EURY|nr:SRPBCC family protein [Natronorubrum daqingense]APX96747.1 hypothetical protein BB347_09020 [Natronorubrum daqingense]SIR58749.1 Uncharacterized membrane protein [Natronorubrum daqingense]
MTSQTNTQTDAHSRSDDRPATGTNRGLGRRERIASATAGGALLWHGLTRRSLTGALTTGAGGFLLYRAATGRSRPSRSLEREGESAPVHPETTPTHDERTADSRAREPTVERSITVGKPAEELESYWRDPEHLSRIVGTFAEVSQPDDEDGDRHRWQVDAPFGRRFEWDSRLVDEQPGSRLTWQSLSGAPIPYEATVRFRSAPDDRGTEVSLEVRYDPPGGQLGNAVMQRLGVVPESLVGTSLRRFKTLAETGDLPSLETNPSGRGTGDLM